MLLDNVDSYVPSYTYPDEVEVTLPRAVSVQPVTRPTPHDELVRSESKGHRSVTCQDNETVRYIAVAVGVIIALLVIVIIMLVMEHAQRQVLIQLLLQHHLK